MGHFAPPWKFLILIVIGLTVPASASPAVVSRSSTCLNPFYNEHVQFIQVHGPYLLPYSLDVDPTADIIRTKLSTLDAAKICTSLDLEPIIIENLDQFKQFSELLLLSIGSGEARSSFSVNLDGIKKNGVLRSIQDSRRVLPFHAFDMRFQPLEKEAVGDKGKNCLNLVCSKKVGDCSFQLVNCIQSQVIPVCQYPKGSACYQDNMVGSRSIEGIDKLVEVGSTATRSFYWSIKQKTWKEALSFCSLNGMQLLSLYPDDDQDMVILFHLLEKFRIRLEVREWMSYSWLNSTDKESNMCALLVSHDDVRNVECTLKAFFVCSIDTSNFRATVEVAQIDEQHPVFVSSKRRRKIILRPQIILKPRLILNTTRMDLTGQLPEIEVRPIIKIEEPSIIKTNNPVPPPLLQRTVQHHPPKDSFDLSNDEVVSIVNKKNKSSAMPSLHSQTHNTIPPTDASTSKPSLPLISQINLRVGAVPGEESLPPLPSCPEPGYIDKTKSRSRLIRLGQDGPYLFPKTIQFMTSTKAHALCTKLGLESALIESPTQYNYLMEQLPQYNQFNELNEFALHLDGITDDTPGKLGEFVTSKSGDDLPCQAWKLTDDGEYFATRATCLVLFCSNSIKLDNDDRNVTDRDCFYKATDCDKDRKVIPLCQYKKESECYQRAPLISTDNRLTQDINRSPLSPVGQSERRVYYGSRKQENWTDAMFTCKSQGLELLSFPKHDTHESHEIWRALEYYKSISGLPHWIGISWTSGRFSEGFGTDEYFTFEKTATPAQYQQERWEYQENEGLWTWHDTLVKKNEVEICMVALSGEMIRPILCEMKNYFICWEKREAVEDEFPLSQAGITERLSSEETVDNSDSGISQYAYFIHAETTTQPPEVETQTEVVEEPKVYFIKETTVNENGASTTTTTTSSTVTSLTSTQNPTDNPMTTVHVEASTVHVEASTVHVEASTVHVEASTVKTVAREVSDFSNEEEYTDSESAELINKFASESKSSLDENATESSNLPDLGKDSKEGHPKHEEVAQTGDDMSNASANPQPNPKLNMDEKASNVPNFEIDSKEGHQKQQEVKQSGNAKSSASAAPQPNTKLSTDDEARESSNVHNFEIDLNEGRPKQLEVEVRQAGDDKSHIKSSTDEKAMESSSPYIGKDSKEGHPKYEEVKQSNAKPNTSITLQTNTKLTTNEKAMESSNVRNVEINSKEGHPKQDELKHSEDDKSNTNTKINTDVEAMKFLNVHNFGINSTESHPKHDKVKQSGDDKSNINTTLQPNTKSSTDEKATEISSQLPYSVKDSKEDYQKHEEVNQVKPSGDVKSNASETSQPITKLNTDEKAMESSNVPNFGINSKDGHPKQLGVKQSDDDKSNISANSQSKTNSPLQSEFKNSHNVLYINRKTGKMSNGNKTRATTSYTDSHLQSEFHPSIRKGDSDVPNINQKTEEMTNDNNKTMAATTSLKPRVNPDFGKVPVEISQTNEQGPNSQNKQFASALPSTSTTVQPILVEQHLKSELGKVAVKISQNNEQEPNSQNKQFPSTSATVKQKSDVRNDSIEKLL